MSESEGAAHGTPAGVAQPFGELTALSEVEGAPSPVREGAAPGRWLLLAGVLVLLYAAGLNNCWRFQRDSALYMGLARSLAETGTYSFGNRLYGYARPGFPLLLAPVYLAFGESFLAMNTLVSVFGLGCIALAWAIFARLPLGRRQVVACALLFAFSRTLYYYSAQILSDVPFTFFALLGLLCGLRMLEARGRAAWLWSAGAAVAAAAACAVRPTGPAVVFALVGAVWLRPGGLREWRGGLARTAVLVGPSAVPPAAWAWRSASVRILGQTSYTGVFLGDWGQLPGKALDAVLRVPAYAAAVGDGVLGSDLGVTVGAVLCLVAAVGLVCAWRRGERLATLYGAAYLAGVALASPGRRYVLPALPVLLFWLVLGAEQVGRWAVRAVRTRAPGEVVWRRACAVGYALVCLALAVNLVRISKVVYECRSPDFYRRTGGERLVHYFELADWLRMNAGPDELIVAREDRMLHYFSRATTVPPLFFRMRVSGPVDLAAVLHRAHVCYFVRDRESDPPEMALLDDLVEDVPDAFPAVRRFGDIELVEVRPERLVAGG